MTTAVKNQCYYECCDDFCFTSLIAGYVLFLVLSRRKWFLGTVTVNLNVVFLLAGCLMRVSDAEVKQQIVESVKSFYSCVAPQELLDGTDRPSKPKSRTVYSDRRFSRLSLSEALSWLLCSWFLPFFSIFLNLLFFSFINVFSLGGSELVLPLTTNSSFLLSFFLSVLIMVLISSSLLLLFLIQKFLELYFLIIFLQVSSQPLRATDCSCWSVVTWLRRCSSPWPHWRTSRE